MNTLKPSAITKTSPVVIRRRTKDDPMPNAFGSAAGSAGTCGDWVSAACDASTGGYCYVVNSRRRYSAIGALLDHNAAMVRALATRERWTELADAHYILMSDSARRQLRAGIVNPLYRLDWSGGVLNDWHARAIAEASTAAHEAFGLVSWIFDRNLTAVPILLKAKGLRVLLSADADNVRAVESFAALYPGVQVAYADPTGRRPDGAARTGRALECPCTRPGGATIVQNRHSPSGWSGACAKCRACVDTAARPDIVFREH